MWHIFSRADRAVWHAGLSDWWTGPSVGEREILLRGEDVMGEQTTPTVLIVEDDSTTQELYRAHLHGRGYNVRTAADGE
jgi:PleD family two-component response regulator